MPKSHNVIFAIKKIIVKRLAYLVLGVSHPHHPNQLNVYQRQKECYLPQGIAENVHTSSKCPALLKKSAPVLSLIDPKHHLEECVISFVVENSLLVSSVPKLIEFARNLSSNHKALLELKMNRTAASYKLVNGLNSYEQKKIVDAMKSYPLSINIGECTSNNHQKVSA